MSLPPTSSSSTTPPPIPFQAGIYRRVDFNIGDPPVLGHLPSPAGQVIPSQPPGTLHPQTAYPLHQYRPTVYRHTFSQSPTYKDFKCGT